LFKLTFLAKANVQSLSRIEKKNERFFFARSQNKLLESAKKKKKSGIFLIPKLGLKTLPCRELSTVVSQSLQVKSLKIKFSKTYFYSGWFISVFT
jgi:hypothetical protein